MRLVPRQLRRTDFRSSVPYFGGRLTPQVIAGMQPAVRGPDADPATAHLIGALDELWRHGKVSEQEYVAIRGRIAGGR